MSAEYLFEKVYETELMNESLATIIQNSEVSSRARSDEFISFGDGIIDANFFMGNLVTEHIDKISINTLSSYILSIPKKGAYSVVNNGKKEEGIDGQAGVLALPSDKVTYQSNSNYVDDYTIIVSRNALNRVIEQKYNVLDFNTDMLYLNLKNEQVQACFQYIESTLALLRTFPDSRNSELVQKNMQEIATFMLVDIIAQRVNAKPLINVNPEKYLVVKAEEVMDAECERLFTIQEIADRVLTSPRNLQRAFKKHSKYTPIQFLQNRKLHKAQNLLLANNNPFCTVKEIAFGVGIFNLGRFSQNYFSLFGEYPSETLKR